MNAVRGAGNPASRNRSRDDFGAQVGAVERVVAEAQIRKAKERLISDPRETSLETVDVEAEGELLAATAPRVDETGIAFQTKPDVTKRLAVERHIGWHIDRVPRQQLDIVATWAANVAASTCSTSSSASSTSARRAAQGDTCEGSTVCRLGAASGHRRCAEAAGITLDTTATCRNGVCRWGRKSAAGSTRSTAWWIAPAELTARLSRHLLHVGDQCLPVARRDAKVELSDSILVEHTCIVRRRIPAVRVVLS